VLTGEEFKRRWGALDKTEQQWVMEAAARGRSESTAQARALIAGYAWRELNRMPWVWTVFVVGVVMFAIVLTFANAPIAALVVIAGMACGADVPPSATRGRLGPQRRLTGMSTPARRERGQLTACFTSAAILASSAAVSSVSAKAVGHIVPSSRVAPSLKPSVAYLVLNFAALWKKQRTLPSLA
jgi:hypothetical protein